MANLSVLAIIVAGIGLWFHKKWGWWLAGSLYMFAIVQAIYMFVMSNVRKDELQQLGIQFDLTPFAKNVVIYPLLIGYLQSSRALKAFGIQPSTRLRWTSLATQFGAAIGWLIISTLLMLFILTRFGSSVPYIE